MKENVNGRWFGSRTTTEKIANAEMVDGPTDGTPFLFPSYDVYGKFVATFCIRIQVTLYWLTLEGSFSFADREFESCSAGSGLPFDSLVSLLNGDMSNRLR